MRVQCGAVLGTPHPPCGGPYSHHKMHTGLRGCAGLRGKYKPPNTLLKNKNGGEKRWRPKAIGQGSFRENCSGKKPTKEGIVENMFFFPFAMRHAHPKHACNVQKSNDDDWVN